MVFGYPLTGEFTERSESDGKDYTVQYFERAEFQYHPEMTSATVMVALLGSLSYKKKYPEGAPDEYDNPDHNFPFPEWGTSIGGRFREYWESTGGVARHGYPISKEFREESQLGGKTYKVQYFERSVFEYHPENTPPYDVLLAQLGRFRLADMHPEALPPTP